MKQIIFSAAVALMLAGGSLRAGQNFVQLALFNPVQLISEGESVEGIRLNLIYSVNRDMTGVDLGFVNKTTGDFLGLADGAINIVDGQATGLQMGFVNIAGSVKGVQFGMVNKAGSLNGIQLGFININDGGPYKILPLVNFAFK